MGRFLLFLPLVSLLVRDFRLFSGPDNFVNRLGAHFEHTVAILEDGPFIITAAERSDEPTVTTAD